MRLGIPLKNYIYIGNYLVVLWLGLSLPLLGSIPDWGTKLLQSAQSKT